MRVLSGCASTVCILLCFEFLNTKLTGCLCLFLYCMCGSMGPTVMQFNSRCVSLYV